MQNSTFWDSFSEGLTAPASLYAEPPPYWSYVDWHSVPQTFSMVGAYWSDAASQIDDGFSGFSDPSARSGSTQTGKQSAR